MPEDIIKGKIVFEGGGVGGGIGGSVGGGGSTATMSGSIMSKRGMMTAVTIPITDVLGKISQGISKLGQLSPMLGAEFIRLKKGLQLFLMPIGDTMANWLRPMAQGWLENAATFYEEYKDGGLASAILGAIQSVFNYVFPTDSEGNISFTGMLENISELVDIAGVISFGVLGLAAGMTATNWFLNAVKATGFLASPLGLVAIGAVLWFAGKEGLEMTGMETWAATLLAGIATALGLGGAAVLGLSTGIGIAFSLLFMAAGGAGYWLGQNWEEFKTWFKEEVNALTGGLVFPEFEKPVVWTDDTTASDILNYIDGAATATSDLDEQTSTLGGVWSSVFGAMQSGWNWLVEAFETGHSPAVLELFPMLGESMESAWTNQLQPSFLNIQEGINDAIYRVVRLHTEVLALPNINRTITYTIKYVRED